MSGAPHDLPHDATTSRRAFVASSAAFLAAAACARRVSLPAASATRLPLGFSTLGCPRWTWVQVLDYAAAHGYAAVELRGLEGEMDLTKRPELAPPRRGAARREVADRGLRLSCLGSSANMHVADAAERAPQMDEARRFIDLAHALGAPYVRVFGNEYPKDEPRAVTRARVAAGLRELGGHAHGSGVAVLIESHGDFTDSASLREILDAAGSDDVALLWDAHHTYVAGEQPEDTVRNLGRWIRHTHLKDSVPAGTDRRYVLTGTGDVPVRRQVAALARAGYRGWYSFEWEKRWHPELEEPEVAFEQFARVAGGYLRDAPAG